jgi:hypothetical protein
MLWPQLVCLSVKTLVTNLLVMILLSIDSPVVLPKHPVHAFNPLMKYMQTSATARLMLLFRNEKQNTDRSSESVSSSEDTLPSHSDSSLSGVERSSGESSFASESDRWTPSELCNGSRHRNVLSESYISPGSGSADSVPPQDAECLSETHSDYNPAIHSHILPGFSADSAPLISLLCMGCSGTIYGLIASTLYQRRSCGLPSVAIGLLLDLGKKTIQVLFGWLGEPQANLNLVRARGFSAPVIGSH